MDPTQGYMQLITPLAITSIKIFYLYFTGQFLFDPVLNQLKDLEFQVKQL